LKNRHENPIQNQITPPKSFQKILKDTFKPQKSWTILTSDEIFQLI